jgi:hypothetical protein
MAASSSTMMTIALMPVSEKLHRGNHMIWKAQVLAVLRGAQLAWFLDGTNKASTEKIKISKADEDLEEEPNPSFAIWKVQEKHVLSYLLTSVSCDILVQIAALPSAVEVWKHIETSFVSQSCTRVINTCMALATSQKGSSTAAEFISKMKSLADDMASARKKLDDEELCSYILAGLDYEYNWFVSSIAARVKPITLGELYSQLISFENRLEIQNGSQRGGQTSSSVNSASRGRGVFSRVRGGGCGRGRNNSSGRGRGDSFNKCKNQFPPCQLCGRTNHPVFKCYKRFDPTYMGMRNLLTQPTSMVLTQIGTWILELLIM